MRRAAKVEEVDRIELEIPLRLGRGQNNREHWAVKMKRNQRERAAVKLAWPKWKKISGPWVVTLCRVAPRGKIDDDNLVATLKAVRDQVAEELGVDDGNSRQILFTSTAGRGPWAVRVVVERAEGIIEFPTQEAVDQLRKKIRGLADRTLKAIGGRG